MTITSPSTATSLAGSVSIFGIRFRMAFIAASVKPPFSGILGVDAGFAQRIGQ
jgi:hypothetical protein